MADCMAANIPIEEEEEVDETCALVLAAKDGAKKDSDAVAVAVASVRVRVEMGGSLGELRARGV